jgi:hypothetical protein
LQQRVQQRGIGRVDARRGVRGTEALAALLLVVAPRVEDLSG